MLTKRPPRRALAIVEKIRLNRLMDCPPPVATSHALAFIAGTFYISGGAITTAAAMVDPDLQHRLVIELTGVTATAAGILVACFASLIHGALRLLMNFLGTGLILFVVLLAGHGSAGAAIFWVFCYISIDAFFFFPWRWAIPMLGWELVASWIATFCGKVIDPTEWYAFAVVAIVVSFVVGWLVRYAADGDWEPATDMLNRGGFDRDIAARCSDSAKTGRRFSLALIRLDDIERLVAKDGSQGGELTARRLAAQWRPDTPPAAIWARIRELNFAVLWDDSPGFDSYLDRVCKQASALNPVSIGVSDYQSGYTPDQMLTDAIYGRAFSERTGGNCVTRAGLITEHVDELRDAIRTGQIVPFYQPIIDLASGRIVSAEALARWVHPDRGVIRPGLFVPIAEQAGLICALGERMLRQACIDAAGWHVEDGALPRVAVNVSGEQLHNAGFVDFVDGCLRDAGLLAARLTIEITESTVAGDDPRALATIWRLRERGITIAMDDFGTGYSNLSRLAHVPIDVLKIDSSFIQHLNGPGQAKALLEGLLVLAERLGLRTVVEGIEQHDQYSFLASAGAHLGQGYLFGRPAPNAAFSALAQSFRFAPAVSSRS